MTCWRKGVKPATARQASPVALNLLVKMPAAVVSTMPTPPCALSPTMAGAQGLESRPLRRRPAGARPAPGGRHQASIARAWRRWASYLVVVSPGPVM